MQKSPQIQKTLQKCIQKNPPRAQFQGAVKAEGLQLKENPGPLPLPGKIRRPLSNRVRSKAEGLPDKENPGPLPLPGKTRDFYDAHPRFIEKTRHSHKRLVKYTVNLH